MALANVFGGGSGWILGTTTDTLVAGVISEVTRQGEEFIDQKLTLLANEIRNQIADAWNKGRKNSASPE